MCVHQSLSRSLHPFSVASSVVLVPLSFVSSNYGSGRHDSTKRVLEESHERVEGTNLTTDRHDVRAILSMLYG